MSKFKETLTLPVEDLKERRKALEEELEKVVVESITSELRETIQKAFTQHGIGKLDKITWEFQGEYDDEGGTDYWPSYIQIFSKNGEIEEGSEEIENIVIKEKSTYSDYVFTYDIFEYVSDKLHGYSSDLYEYDIEELVF